MCGVWSGITGGVLITFCAKTNDSWFWQIL